MFDLHHTLLLVGVHLSNSSIGFLRCFLALPVFGLFLNVFLFGFCLFVVLLLYSCEAVLAGLGLVWNSGLADLSCFPLKRLDLVLE